MSGPVWLSVAILAAAAAYLVGWPAWQASRRRATRDTNTERYLAWRGRGREGRATPEGPSADERRRIVVAGVLAALSIASLVGFFVTT
jgi:hypothetical protein